MIVTILGKRYRLSPGLTAFIRGMQTGAGWAIAFCAVLFLFWLFLVAAEHYVLWH